MQTNLSYFGRLCCGLMLLAATAIASAKSEGVDLEVGGPGNQPGQFAEVRDILFAQGHFYILEGQRVDRKTNAVSGNLRVQQMDTTGKFLSLFSIADPAAGLKQNPVHLTVDSSAVIYVADPGAGVIDRFAAAGKKLSSIALPNAAGIAFQKVDGADRIVVAINPPRPKQKGAELPPVELATINPATGQLGEPIKLDQPISNCTQLICDAAGNLYFKAGESQIFKYDPQGKFVHVFGAGTKRRLQDGSELVQTVAVDSKQNVYTITPGNPGSVCKFTPDGLSVTMRRGQYGFADTWGYSRLLTFVCDDQDRLWAADNGKRETGVKAHALPCVIRTLPNFFDDTRAVTTRSTIGLGLVATATTDLPDQIGYELKSTSVDLVVAPGKLNIHEVTGVYVVHDVYKNEIATGSYSIRLKDDEENHHSITFTPPKWGWYVVEFSLRYNDEMLASGGTNIGFTPQFTGMPILHPGESTANWADPARQEFAGQNLMRLHPTAKLDAFEKDLTNAEKFHAPLFAQFSSLKECDPDFVKQVVTKYKDRVKYWEIMNEPNFSMNVQQYTDLVKKLQPIIKEIDPQAVVMGCDHCGIDLDWYRKFYELGGGKLLDVLSIHDYEGHETIDAFHWRWKLGELRKIMADNDDAAKPIWQTERCISSLRAGTFMGPLQAVRVTMHEDLLQTLGIPVEHNLYYYLNEGGYKSVPAYTWSHLGPYPATFATRTRAAMVINRDYKGAIDWGQTGNNMLLGLNYSGVDGTTIIVRNFGTADLPVTFDVVGTQSVEVVDAFGNASILAVQNGQLTLMTTALPQYLRLKPSESATARKIDYGRDYAPELSFTCSGDFKGDLASINNGVFESPHGSDPRRYLYFSASLKDGPQCLEMQLPKPRTIDHLVMWNLHADNAMCALLDYDLEYFDGGKWQPLKQVRTNVPKSNLAPMSDFKVLTWDLDQSFSSISFLPVTSDRFRITALRATYGLLPDIDAAQMLGSKLPPTLMIREMQLFGPAGDVEIASRVAIKSLNVASVKVTIANHRKQSISGNATLTAPTGWTISPATIPVVSIVAGESLELNADLTGPEKIDAGLVPITVAFNDAANQPIDCDRVSLSVPAPVSFNVKSQPKDGKVVQAVEVKNISNATLSCTVQVTLAPVAGSSAKPVTTEISLDGIEPGKAKGSELAIPELDPSVPAWKTTFTATLGNVTVTAHQTLLRD